MDAGKKIWFKGLSRRLWIPVSVEGWGVTITCVLGLLLVFKINKVSGGEPFSLAVHWPMLAELACLTLALWWITRGHVDKKY